VLIIIIVAIVASWRYSDQKVQQRNLDYARRHHCRVVYHTSTSGWVSNGESHMIPATDLFLCEGNISVAVEYVSGVR
jgi:hypothetical protein